MRKNLVKVLLSTFLVIILFLSFIFVFDFPSSNKVNAVTDNVYVNKGVLTDVPENFSFEIKSNHNIDNRNYHNFIRIADINDNQKEDLNIEKKGDYYVVSPQTNYTPGTTYFITLTDAEFVDPTYKNTLAITIKREKVENVEYKSSVIVLDQNEAPEIDGENKTIKFQKDKGFKKGDILIIPTLMPDSDIYVDVAYKVEAIHGNEIDFSVPELEEIYSKFEIANTFAPSIVKAYDIAEIEEQILNNPEIQALSKALYDLKYSETSGEPQNTKLIPTKLDVKFKSLNPLDVTITIVWKINDDMKFTISLRYEKTTTVSFYADDNEKRQTTTEIGKWTISSSLNYDIFNPKFQDIIKNTAIRNKYAQVMHDAYDAEKELKNLEKALKNPNLTDEERENLELEKHLMQMNLDYSDLDKHFLEMENKNAALLKLKSMTKYYKSQMQESGADIKFVQLLFPVYPGVAFTVDSGAVLDFSVSASLEGKLVIESVQEVATVTGKNKHEDLNSSSYKISGYVGICGKAELKIGANISVGVTIAGVFNLKVSFEGGIYAEFSALGAVFFGNTEGMGLPDEASELAAEAEIINSVKVAGTIDFDIGWYYTLKGTVSFDLWVINPTFSYEIGDKTSFLNHEREENNIFQELVFEDDTDCETLEELIESLSNDLLKGSTYDFTPTFEIDYYTGLVTLPNVYIRTIDLQTGDITYDPVDPNDLVFLNQDQVFFNGLTCYAKEYYAEEIDNRLNIRLSTDEEPLSLLKLPVRIVKEPIAVESVNIQLYDQTLDIGLTENKELLTEVLPYNATYQNLRYDIEKIQKADGSWYTGNLSQYAYIENNTLFTTNQIEIGAKIYLSATAIVDEVKSNTLVVTVRRINIERIDFCDSYQRNDINPGEELALKVTIYPENATINVLNDSLITVTLSDHQSATLTKIDDRNYLLTAVDDIANEGKILELTVSAENYSRDVYYQISLIPVESIVIYNEDTNLPLEHDITVYRNTVLNLSAVITPVNASVKQANFNLASNLQNFGRFASIDADGTLTISADAPFGMELYLSATALRKSSGAYKITVTQIPIENVQLIPDKSYIVKNTIMYLRAYVYPDYADIITTQFRILNAPTGVFISGNMLFASAAAQTGTEIQLVAIVNGIQSEVMTVTVIDNPEVPIIPKEGETPEEFVHNTESTGEVIINNEP